MAGIRAFQAIYGKPTKGSGYAYWPGYDHGLTAISESAPADIAKHAAKPFFSKDNGAALVSNAKEATGGVLLSPVFTEDAEYYAISRIRAFSESGISSDGSFKPGRTYTLVHRTYFFLKDWQENAPEILNEYTRRVSVPLPTIASDPTKLESLPDTFWLDGTLPEATAEQRGSSVALKGQDILAAIQSSPCSISLSLLDEQAAFLRLASGAMSRLSMRARELANLAHGFKYRHDTMAVCFCDDGGSTPDAALLSKNDWKTLSDDVHNVLRKRGPVKALKMGRYYAELRAFLAAPVTDLQIPTVKAVNLRTHAIALQTLFDARSVEQAQRALQVMAAGNYSLDLGAYEDTLIAKLQSLMTDSDTVAAFERLLAGLNHTQTGRPDQTPEFASGDFIRMVRIHDALLQETEAVALNAEANKLLRAVREQFTNGARLILDRFMAEPVDDWSAYPQNDSALLKELMDPSARVLTQSIDASSSKVFSRFLIYLRAFRAIAGQKFPSKLSEFIDPYLQFVKSSRLREAEYDAVILEVVTNIYSQEGPDSSAWADQILNARDEQSDVGHSLTRLIQSKFQELPKALQDALQQINAPKVQNHNTVASLEPSRQAASPESRKLQDTNVARMRTSDMIDFLASTAAKPVSPYKNEIQFSKDIENLIFCKPEAESVLFRYPKLNEYLLLALHSQSPKQNLNPDTLRSPEIDVLRLLRLNLSKKFPWPPFRTPPRSIPGKEREPPDFSWLARIYEHHIHDGTISEFDLFQARVLLVAYHSWEKIGFIRTQDTRDAFCSSIKDAKTQLAPVEIILSIVNKALAHKPAKENERTLREILSRLNPTAMELADEFLSRQN